MNFKKITATVLACTTLYNTLNVYAIHSRLDEALNQDDESKVITMIQENPSYVLEYRDEQLTELKRLMGEYINVPPETIDSIHPLFLAITFETLNNVFHKYPNIKKAFIRMIQRRGGKAFSIVTINQPKTEPNKILQCQYLCNDNPELRINIDTYGNSACIFDCISNLRVDQANGIHPKVDNNIKSFMASIVAHEIGHLIEYLVIFDEKTHYLPTDDALIMEKYKEYSALTEIFNGEDKLKRSLACKELFQKSPFEVASKLESDALLASRRYTVYSGAKAEDIKNIIIFGLNISAIVSTYGEENNDEWFAELFCVAMCHHNLKLGPVFKVEPIELLKYRMLEWLDTIEKMYAE